MSQIDLSVVHSQMIDLTDSVQHLDGVDLDDNDAVANKRQYAAEVTRDLLHLADSLDLLAALVRNEYWRTKGFSDRTVMPE